MSRSGIGGRKSVIIPNPFVLENKFGDIENMLCVVDREDIRVEDIILGCVRSFNSHLTTRQDYVNWYKVLKVYKNCNTITRPIIQQYLQCSESQAKRYVLVIKLANRFLMRLVEGALKTNIIGYPDMQMYKINKFVPTLTIKDLTNFTE